MITTKLYDVTGLSELVLCIFCILLFLVNSPSLNTLDKCLEITD